MKTKTLEDALFDTGAPDEIILLAMVEACKQDEKILNYSYDHLPFMGIVHWSATQQGFEFWFSINQLYRIR